jgi:hypothetical protein
MRSSIAPVVPVDVASDADAADEESGFSPVVRLVAHCPVSLFAHWLVIDALWPRLAFEHCRLYGGGTLPQVPADAHASEVVDSTLAEPVAAAAALGSASHDSGCVQSDSEVPAFGVVTAFCCALRAMP